MDIHNDIAAALELSEVVAFVRLYVICFHGVKEMKVSIVKAYKGDENPNPNITIVLPNSPSPTLNKHLVISVGSTISAPTTHFPDVTSTCCSKSVTTLLPTKTEHNPEARDKRPKKKR
uniref:Uncharacterized protein n=2 Tax=Lactuca sativa TaxID=4236 RepID=A0A9R1WW27_LACSA|nr:hypothetical protein LSAT_V11C800454710 [Lactuca sativa]